MDAQRLIQLAAIYDKQGLYEKADAIEQSLRIAFLDVMDLADLEEDKLPSDHPMHFVANQITMNFLNGGQNGEATAHPHGIKVKTKGHGISPVIQKIIERNSGGHPIEFVL